MTRRPRPEVDRRSSRRRCRRPAGEDPAARAEDGAPSGPNQLTGTVRDASYLGVSTQYIVEPPRGERVTVYEQNVERTTRAEFWAPGEAVVLTWSPDHTFASCDGTLPVVEEEAGRRDP